MKPGRESGAHPFRREYDLQAPLPDKPAIANLGNAILADALLSHAQRIQFVLREPAVGNVEYEIASQWRVVAQLPHQAFGALINRLKVMSGLDIGRVPVQEGELHLRSHGTPLILTVRTEATSSPYEQVMISGLPARAS